MNLSRFFEHWSITENPFRGEEARQDPVFQRLGTGVRFAGDARAESPAPAGEPDAIDGPADGEAAPARARAPGAKLRHTTHSDFEKIVGEFDRPSTSIVFGEKGSGKTAIRLQIADRVRSYNAAHDGSRCLLVAYDDLNPILDRFHENLGGSSRKRKPEETLGKFRLHDHIDALLAIIVPRLVDGLLREGAEEGRMDLGGDARKIARRLDPDQKMDLLLLQAMYDRPERTRERTRSLRRLLRVALPFENWLWTALAFAGWVLPLGVIIAYWQLTDGPWTTLWTVLLVVALTLWTVFLLKKFAWDRIAFLRMGHKVARQIRISSRDDSNYAGALSQLPPAAREPAELPTTDSDEQRYAMLNRLKALLRQFGYSSVLVVIDRVDEPTLISGDPERMRSLVWPMMNNKFLQQDGLGIKMLLPIELRHALFRESAAFFQEARLDKSNLIERLTWTGAMLYDLCNARLQACRPETAEPISLLDLFAEDVSRQDLVDALDQMHQPRDAFKMLYQCFTEHCSNVTEDQNQWRIPRLVLETVRKSQADRVQMLYRGVRPA